MFFSTVCRGAVMVEVAPKVEGLKGETAKLPCKYRVSPSSSNTVVEWYIVSNFWIFMFFIQIFFDHDKTKIDIKSLTSKLWWTSIKYFTARDFRHNFRSQVPYFLCVCVFLLFPPLLLMFFPTFFVFHPLSVHPEGGAGNQEACGFPLPGRWRKKWWWHSSDWAGHYRRGLYLDHLLGSTFRWACLLLPGHCWSSWGWRCRHNAQSLLWVGHFPFGLLNDLNMTFSKTLPPYFPISEWCKEFMPCFVTVSGTEGLWL